MALGLPQGLAGVGHEGAGGLLQGGQLLKQLPFAESLCCLHLHASYDMKHLQCIGI